MPVHRNLDAMRYWGHAKDNVRMRWMILQQDQPDDFVIATGVQRSVWQFIEWSAQQLGIISTFEGKGNNKVATVKNIEGNNCLSPVKVG